MPLGQNESCFNSQPFFKALKQCFVLFAHGIPMRNKLAVRSFEQSSLKHLHEFGETNWSSQHKNSIKTEFRFLPFYPNWSFLKWGELYRTLFAPSPDTSAITNIIFGLCIS